MPWGAGDNLDAMSSQQRSSSVDFSGLDKLIKDFDKVIKAFPEMRSELHEKYGVLLKKELDRQILASGLSDTRGKIKGWQESEVGSGGGYVAIRPKKTDVKETGNNSNNSPGAITNYLEGGHKIRGRAKMPKEGYKPGYRYRPRINKIYVDGFHFYEKTTQVIEGQIINETEDFVNELAKMLGG